MPLFVHEIRTGQLIGLKRYGGTGGWEDRNDTVRAISRKRSGFKNRRGWNIELPEIIDPSEGARRKESGCGVNLDCGKISARDATEFIKLGTNDPTVIATENK